MKNKNDIETQVKDTFKVLDTIEKVNVHHFFKHKVLQKIEAEKTQEQTIFSWFKPQFQLAALGLILLLNATAIFYAYNSSENTTAKPTLEKFAEEYSLQSSYNSLLN